MGFLDLPWNKEKVKARQKEFAEQRLNFSHIQGLLNHPGWKLFKEHFLDVEKKEAERDEVMARKKKDIDNRDLAIILLEFFERMDVWFDRTSLPPDKEQEKVLKGINIE